MIINIYRLYEKSDDTTDLIGTNKYFIKTEDDDIFIGNEINNIESYIFDKNNIYKWIQNNDLNIIKINLTQYKYTFLKNNLTSINIRLCYTDKIFICKNEFLDDNIVEYIIEELIKKEELNINDKQLLNELLGENSYVQNNQLKFLFLYSQILI